MRPGSATVVLHHSMVKLPEHPMMPRLFDERVGYFTVRQMDYGRDEQRAPKRIYITRWRLEKKDPSAAAFRAGEADRLLHRRGHAGEVGALHESAAWKAGRRPSKRRDSRTPSSRNWRPLQRKIRISVRRTCAIR